MHGVINLVKRMKLNRKHLNGRNYSNRSPSFLEKRPGLMVHQQRRVLPLTIHHPERSGGMCVRAKDPVATKAPREKEGTGRTLGSAAAGSFAPHMALYTSLALDDVS